MVKYRDLPRRLLASSFGGAFLRTFLARAGAAFGTFFLLLVIARIFGASGAGVYALAYSILMGAGMLARTGMDNALMRYVGQDASSPNTLLYLRWALTFGSVIAITLSVLILLARNAIEARFEAVDLSSVLVGMAIAIPGYVAGLILSGFFKGVGMPATASLLDNGIISFFAALFLLFIYFALDVQDLLIVGLAYGLAAWVACGLGYVSFCLWRKKQLWHGSWARASGAITVKQFRTTSNAFFAIHLASFLYTVLGLLVAGYYLSSSELGLVKTAQQTAVLIGFVSIVINFIVPARFARMYHDGQLEALGRLARRAALLGAVVALPIVLLCLVFPTYVLAIFGPEFKEGAGLLRVIALAQAVNVATGSVALLLSMTGHEKLMRNISLFCSGVGFLLFFLTPVYGPAGTIFAMSFVMVAQNIIALYYVWRRLAIWTLPIPNVLKLMGISPIKML